MLRFARMIVGAGAVMLLVTAAASASTWGGHNGVVRLSFTSGDTLTSSLNVAPEEGGVVITDLYAVLDGVEPAVYNGTTVASLGGLELRLQIEGAEYLIMSQEFPFANFNVGQKPGDVRVGAVGGLPLEDGRATLVHWQVLLKGKPRDVTFRLDPAGARSCETLQGCPGSGTDVLWTGSVEQKLEGLIFSAVGAPAYLNWEEAPAAVAGVGSPSWRDVGACQPPAAGEAPSQ
jgi:hypothetical protein